MLNSSRLQKFSTDDIPDRDKISLWRDHFGRSVVKMDFVPIGEVSFRCVSFMRDLPDLKIWSCAITESEVHRTRSLAADGDDNLVLAVVRKGRASASQGGREVVFGGGEAVLWSADIAGVYRNLSSAELFALALPRRILTSMLSDPNTASMTVVPSSTDALRLLIQYVDTLCMEPGPMSPALQALTATHVQDLVSLALSPTRDAKEVASMRGLRAARLLAIKRDVLANLGEQSLSVSGIASRHSISPRYIRSLFESDQTTFTDFVREQRLQLARRMLTDASLAYRSISTIAFDAGFGDISHFNQLFRRRFGATPTGVRGETRKPSTS
jgi:AraC-like DNA-binding protein